MKNTNRNSSSVGLWFAGLCGLAVIGGAVLRHAHGDGVAQVMTSKDLTAATVAVIDPESGTSSGGSGTDVRIAVGDIISFKFRFTPVPDKVNRGLQGYLTEYLPPNTEVVGVRITDANGNTILPRYPGIAADGCTGGSTCNSFNNLPCTAGTCSFQTGSIAQVHGDVGIFYSEDPLTAKVPSNAFITMNNGITMSPQPATISPGIVALLNDTTAPYFAHNEWDWDQVRAYGTSSAIANTGGDGNTPYRYGSPVAGPLTFYNFEASRSGSNIFFDNVNGPWERISYPGSTISFGAADIGSTSNITRNVTETTAGFDLTPATASSINANAIRVALGETRTGEPGFVEVAVRVTGIPLDPAFNPTNGNIDCGEVFGTDTSSRGTNSGAKDNPWPTYIGSPACVFLKLFFELNVDKSLATGADNLTYTLNGSNLSITDETGVVVRLKFDQSRQALVSANLGFGTNPPSIPPNSVTTCADDATLQCMTWNIGTLAPGADYKIVAVMDVGGGGQTTNIMQANYVSNQVPAPGFTNQALTIVAPIAVPKITLAPNYDPTATFATQGSTASITGVVTNIGTEIFSSDDLGLVLPTGWTINGALTLGGTTLSCISGCTGNRPTYDVSLSFTPSQQRTLAFSVNVPSGANGATGLYRIDASITGSQSGFGGTWETYFARAATINVNQRRTVRPIVTCPIASTQPSISGTSEADAAISVRFNLMQRGTATAAAAPADTAAWSSSNYGAFGELYGGLEVTATATAPGELESEPSLPCFVSNARQCSDGFDNDGDMLIDFPNDPGCENPGDNTENTPGPQCSDGVDNDADMQVDWPFDVGCQGPTDTTENSGPACSDGLDNDGDMQTDFPADPDCTSATDGSETFYRACQDGLDNDGDTFRDFPNDTGCHSAFDDDETNPNATPVVKPRLLLLFDSSGSMNWNTCNDTFTGGDGSSECAGSNVPCATCTSATCSNTFADDSRLFKVKAGITDAVSAFGEVEYGLMRFHQNPVDFLCPSTNAGLRSGAWQGGGAAPCGFVNAANPGFNAGDLLVSFGRDNEQTLLDWINGDSDYPGAPQAYTDLEIRGSGTTPLGGILTSANSYLDTVRAGDTQLACRPYRVILVTDGAETCGGNPVQAATDLRNDGALVYVVGFATPDQSVINNLNAIAAAGGGNPTAIFVDDEAELSAAIADIIADSIIQERCNGLDDDCDMFIDEDFPDLGLPPNPPPPQTCDNGQFGVCARTGVRVCAADGLGTTCNAPTITPGMETCNGLDDDCDRSIDENLGGCQTCTAEERAQPEICNNLDDNCNGMVDEAPIAGVGTSCGLDIGECSFGTLQCTNGNLVCTGGQGPVNETCNMLDDDCDTLTDEIAVECYTPPTGCTPNGSGGFNCVGLCRSGVQTCNGNMLGACMGEVGPVAELCNGADDDCDTRTDEAFPGLGGACDNGQLGVCRQTGTLVCNSNGTGTACTAPTVTPGIEVCNNLDDDCDGQVDEMLGPPIGTTCGGSGSCSAGTFQCVMGVVTCVGSMGGMPEVCNAVDDDCDNSIDEAPLPGTGGDCVDPGFGTFDMQGNCTGACDVGECEFGTLICAGGVIVCDDYIGPRPEVCNGLDDDCDGNADDMATCPVGGQACLQGECANPCAAGEFPCPFGFYCQMGPVPGPSDDFCVRDPCATVNCQPGEVCDQMTGMCEDLCDGVTCPAGLTCFGGICQDCFSLGCDPGELCVREGTEPGQCVPDPCFNVQCQDNEACVDGVCEAVTCDPPCAANERCEDGTCIDDPCNGVNCGALQVCDPRTGDCVDNLCRDRVCGNGQVCHPGTGECISDPCLTIDCPPGLVCNVDFEGNGQCEVPPAQTCANPPCTITTGGGGGCDAGGGHGKSGLAAALLLILLGIVVRPRVRATGQLRTRSRRS